MKKTSHTTHNHKRRKPIPGLTPAALIEEMKKVANGKSVRNVRSSHREEEPVLPGTREEGTGEARRTRIFGESEGTGGGGAAVSDASASESSLKTQLSRVLKRMLTEIATSEDGDGGVVTNAERLAAVVQREAFAGKQWACEFIRDMAEGKPVRAAQLNNTDVEIESQLDRVSIAALNRLTKKESDNG